MPGPATAPTPESHRDLVAYVDGASRGNPGPASYGVVIRDQHGATLETLSRFLGQATNNVAEYHALLAALEYAANQKAHRLRIYCDSELVARQMQGSYRVHSPDLLPLYRRARELASQIGSFSIRHVRREQNREADDLANQALDEAATQRVSRESRGKTVPSRAEPLAEADALVFLAVVEEGKLRPLPPLPRLEEGVEYEVRASRRPRPAE